MKDIKKLEDVENKVDSLYKDCDVYDYSINKEERSYNDGLSDCRKVYEEYLDNQKVVIPQFVADWVDKHKAKYDEDQIGYLIGEYNDDNLPNKVNDFYENNDDILYRALLDDYTVEEPKFKLGNYYSFESGGNREIFKVVWIKDSDMKVKSYLVKQDKFNEEITSTEGNATAITYSEKAIEEEIKIFRVAEMYHNRKRNYGELKVGDTLFNPTTKEYRICLNPNTFRENVENGRYILYLTIEEMQEAHNLTDVGVQDYSLSVKMC